MWWIGEVTDSHNPSSLEKLLQKHRFVNQHVVVQKAQISIVRASYATIISKDNGRHLWRMHQTQNTLKSWRRNSQWMMATCQKRWFSFSVVYFPTWNLKLSMTPNIVTLHRFNNFVRFSWRFSQLNTRFKVRSLTPPPFLLRWQCCTYMLYRNEHYELRSIQNIMQPSHMLC